ncbi:MAG: class IV adenylate cyclase [Candidatus Dormibacteraeota bacterium]|nr:class IV adenylate cyclase [Candidatus Dormibacteraeota bacterium]
MRHGRLKLRQEWLGGAHLVQYDRPDLPEQRQSRYRVVAAEDSDGLWMALEALGVVTVQKDRHLFLWRQVRIHLDDVCGLGRFIELEAVASEASDLAGEHRLVAELRGTFGITDDRLCATGYARQVLQAQQ